ncbi:carcinine hydrolase/isopenicillin-N N-acyltransferase family protein [Actinosynnema sp. NPDC020468]|uniref:carcinine hydrolase/isopenicillin-N N-acyltransferase family protein n=1 Tax=Actinosynnema sp. NPDC020468 TaxID=3154488 RepID=UPI0033C64D80
MTRGTTFRAFGEDDTGSGWREHVRRHWPRLRQGAVEEPGAVARRAAVLDLASPGLARMWEGLTHRANLANSAFASFLTHVDPAPLAVHGRQATAGRALVRNLDATVERHEATLWLSRLGARRVMGTTSGLWGLLDGMNEDGLAVSLTSGGRFRHGRGLSGPILVRHLLEHCATVTDVDAAVFGWRSAGTHDLTVLDAAGNRAAYRVSPDGPTRRGRTDHWDSTAVAVSAMLRPPRLRTDYAAGVGTLYTAVYRPTAGNVTFLWPDRMRTWGFADFAAAEVAVEYRTASAR